MIVFEQKLNKDKLLLREKKKSLSTVCDVLIDRNFLDLTDRTFNADYRSNEGQRNN